jgi:hypothetical protein
MNDPLDDLLRAQPYVDDAGFSRRVLDALPPRRNPRELRRRVLALASLVALAAGLVAPAQALLALLHGAPFSWPLMAAVAVALAVGAGTAVSVALREAES